MSGGMWDAGCWMLDAADFLFSQTEGVSDEIGRLPECNDDNHEQEGRTGQRKVNWMSMGNWEVFFFILLIDFLSFLPLRLAIGQVGADEGEF